MIRRVQFPATRSRGFTMVETAVSTLLVGLLLVGALRTAGSSMLAQNQSMRRAQAAALADSLMTDILGKSYMEPGATASAITRESGESSTSKVSYDDVDDFNQWQEQPPQAADGTALSNLSGWKRKVLVSWVSVSGTTIASTSTESNIKQVTVQVFFNGALVLTRISLATNS